MKPSILLLHGAIGAAAQLDPLAENLSSHFDVHLFNFPGHGGTPMSAEPFSIKLFSDATLEFIQNNKLQDPLIFGYSMGGYVAMFLAKENPGLIKKIITLGTKFYWNETVAAKEIKMLDAEAITAKVPAFAAALEKLHAPNDWKRVLQHTATMLTSMGKNNPLNPGDYKMIQTPSLIMLGDRDKMVTPEETGTVFNNLAHAQMKILENTPHPIEQVDVSLLAEMICR